MDIQKLVSPAVDWTDQTWAQRVDQAGTLLFVQGFITAAQRTAITRKLEKLFADGIASGAIVERPS